MHPRPFFVPFLLGSCLFANVGDASAQSGKRRAVPSETDQARARKLIAELFPSDLAKAKSDVAAGGRLAQTFLAEARDTQDDPAGKYVLLRDAYVLSAKAGDILVALQALDDLSQDFSEPGDVVWAMKLAALEEAAKSKASFDANRGIVVDSSLSLLEESLARDDFPSSLKLLRSADKAAVEMRNLGLVASIRRRLVDVQRLEKEFATWKPFADRLKQKPDDVEANLEMGKYHALIKGNWDLGLPLLAKGHGPLQALAHMEVSKNPAGNRSNLAAVWAKLALEQTGRAKVNALLHAHELCLDVLAESPPDRDEVLDRMRKIQAELPPEYRVGELKTERRKVETPFGPVYGCDLSSDGKRLAMTAVDGVARIWDLTSGKEMRRLPGHVGRIWAIAFSPNGRQLFTGGFDGSIRQWDVFTGREIRRLAGHSDYVRSLAVDPSGRILASAGDDRVVRLWDVATGKELRTLKGHGHFVWCVAFSGNGKRIASASLDKTVRLWDAQTGDLVTTLKGHDDTVLAVAFTPDGKHVVSGSTDKTIRVWDVEKQTALRTLTGHTGYVHSLAISPDGRRLISAGQDGSVKLWDVDAGVEVRTLQGHRDQVWSVAFSRDGRLAASGGQDNTVRVWAGSR